VVRAARVGQRSLTETQFQSRVMDYARLRGWSATHFRPAQIRPGRWATPLQGDPGFVDLVLARRGVVLHVELKADGKYPTAEQKRWGTSIGDSYRLWRPKDWDRIMEELR